MKRLRTSIMFLLVALVLNVGSAWLLAAFHGVDATSRIAVSNILPDFPQMARSGFFDDDWGVAASETYGWTRVVSKFRPETRETRHEDDSDYSSFYTSLTFLTVPYNSVKLDTISMKWSRVVTGEYSTYQSMIEDAYGWPMRSLLVRHQVESTGQSKVIPAGLPIRHTDASLLSLLRFANDRWALPRVLPLVPIWLGMVGNTVVYVPALMLIFYGPRWIRRAVRRRRGCCSECGYNLHGHHASGCPECGWNRPAGEGEAREGG